MHFGRKKTLMDRAHDVADQVAEAVIPHLETALEQTKEKAGPALTDARDRALPLLAEGKALAAEKAALASEKASAGASLAAERAQIGAALAADRAAAGRTLAAAKVAELRGEQAQPEPKGGRLKKLLLVSGLVALGSVLAGRMRGRKESANWQSSYQPAPPPPAPSTPSSGAATATRSSGTPFAETTEDTTREDLVPPTPISGDPLTDPLPDSLTSTPDAETEDVGGGAPGEAMSDTVEEPRQPTTPDAPADVVDIDDGPRDR